MRPPSLPTDQYGVQDSPVRTSVGGAQHAGSWHGAHVLHSSSTDEASFMPSHKETFLRCFLLAPPPSPLLPIPQCKTFLWLLMGWNRFYWDLLSSLWFFSEPEFYWVRIGSTVLLWTGGVVDALRNFLERRDSSALYLGLASAPRNDIKLPRPLLPHPLPWSFLRNKKKMVRSPIHRPIITHRFKSSGAEKSNLKCFFLTAMTLCSLCLRNEDCFPYFLFKSFDSQFLLSHL